MVFCPLCHTGSLTRCECITSALFFWMMEKVMLQWNCRKVSGTILVRPLIYDTWNIKYTHFWWSIHLTYSDKKQVIWKPGQLSPDICSWDLGWQCLYIRVHKSCKTEGYFLFLIWNLHVENQHDFRKTWKMTFTWIRLQVPLAKVLPAEATHIPSWKVHVPDRFANKTNSLHVYKYIRKSLYV